MKYIVLAAIWTLLAGCSNDRGVRGSQSKGTSTDTSQLVSDISGTDSMDSVQGADSTDSVDAAASIDGTDGADGTDGVASTGSTDGTDAVDSTDGSDGTDNLDGTDGTDGTDNLDGTDGTDGTDDLDGTDGTDGTDDLDGTDGIDAVDGVDGTDGTDGMPGNGVPDPFGDQDQDKVPNNADFWPNDPTKPLIVAPSSVYAHSASTLYSMHVKTQELVSVGKFKFPGGKAGSITDLAIDSWGVIYAITFKSVFICNATDASCFYLGGLNKDFNGLSFIPKGYLDDEKDVLVGISNGGSVERIDIDYAAQKTKVTALGSYGSGWKSSGDLFSMAQVGTFAAVDNPVLGSVDYLISVDPKTGKAIGQIAKLAGYSSVYGLAGWFGSAYAFDSSGAIIRIDLETGETTLVKKTNVSFWGAGVRARVN